jgi:hypothetical protein
VNKECVEKVIDLPNNVEWNTVFGKTLTGTLMRVIEGNVNEQVWITHGEVVAPHKEVRSFNYWNDESLRYIQRRLGVKQRCKDAAKVEDGILIPVPYSIQCHSVSFHRSSVI